MYLALHYGLCLENVSTLIFHERIFSWAWEPTEGLGEVPNFLNTSICFIGHSELENHFVVQGEPRE